MTGERWNDIIQMYEQRQLTFPECRKQVKTEVGEAKDSLATDEIFIAAVTRRLRDKNFRIRLLACESLGVLACPAAVAPLLQADDRESSREVRKVIQEGLLGFPESCIPELLGNGTMRRSYLAHKVLVHLGRPAVELICDLLARASTQHDLTSLVSILRQIGDRGPARLLRMLTYLIGMHGGISSAR